MVTTLEAQMCVPNMLSKLARNAQTFGSNQLKAKQSQSLKRRWPPEQPRQAQLQRQKRVMSTTRLVAPKLLDPKMMA